MSIATVQGFFHCLVTCLAFSANRSRRNIGLSDCDFFIDGVVVAITNQVVLSCLNFCFSAGTAAFGLRFCLCRCLFSSCFLSRSFCGYGFASSFVSCGRFSCCLSSCLFYGGFFSSFRRCGFSRRCLSRRFFNRFCRHFGNRFFSSCLLSTSSLCSCSFRCRCFSGCFLCSGLGCCSSFGCSYFFCSISACIRSCLLSCFFGCCHVPPYDDYASNDRKNKSGKNAPQNCSCKIPPVFNELT